MPSSKWCAWSDASRNTAAAQVGFVACLPFRSLALALFFVRPEQTHACAPSPVPAPLGARRGACASRRASTLPLLSASLRAAKMASADALDDGTTALNERTATCLASAALARRACSFAAGTESAPCAAFANCVVQSRPALQPGPSTSSLWTKMVRALARLAPACNAAKPTTRGATLRATAGSFWLPC